MKLLSPDTIELIFQEQTNGMDLVLGKPLRFGIGYGLPLPKEVPMVRIPSERVPRTVWNIRDNGTIY